MIYSKSISNPLDITKLNSFVTKCEQQLDVMLKERDAMMSPGSPCIGSSVTNTENSHRIMSCHGGAACAGCGGRIHDRFYLLAVDRQWHSSCLKCSECKLPLDSELTCFSRDGNIYCKEDYYR